MVVLPGVDHSDFCPGFAVPGDLPSEVPQAAASAMIGEAIAAFLSLHTLYATGGVFTELEGLPRKVCGALMVGIATRGLCWL